MPNIAVIYYSATGNVHALAKAVAEGAEGAGAEVRLRRAKELAPAEAIDANPAWRAHVDATFGQVEEAVVDDLAWADGIALGTPTRFGAPTAQLKQFIDQTGPLWGKGELADKAATTFTSSMHPHGGQESTVLAVNNVFYHWGCVIVPPGYTDDAVSEAGGNPYGTSWTGGTKGEKPDAAALAAARYQGERLTRFAAALASMPST